MKPFIYKSIKTFIICLFITSASVANFVMADFESGIKAYQEGDHKTAFNEYQAAAFNKNKHAYAKLAGMYLFGLGTNKDYHQAYTWFHMAYLSGDKEAERFRDAASSMMNREQYLAVVEAAEKQRIKLDLPEVPLH